VALDMVRMHFLYNCGDVTQRNSRAGRFNKE